MTAALPRRQRKLKTYDSGPESAVLLRERREKLGLTQRALARILEVDVMTVWRWEHNRRSVPTYAHLVLDTLETAGWKMVTSLGWLQKMREENQ